MISNPSSARSPTPSGSAGPLAFPLPFSMLSWAEVLSFPLSKNRKAVSSRGSASGRATISPVGTGRVYVMAVKVLLGPGGKTARCVRSCMADLRGVESWPSAGHNQLRGRRTEYCSRRRLMMISTS